MEDKILDKKNQKISKIEEIAWWSYAKWVLISWVAFAYFVWFILFCIGSVYDLSISILLIKLNKDFLHYFSILMAALATPIMIVVGSVIFIAIVEKMYYTVFFELKAKNILVWIIYFIVLISLIVASYFLITKILNDDATNNVIVIFAQVIVIFIYTYLFIYFRSNYKAQEQIVENFDRYIRALVFVALFSLTVLIFKYFFGRIRFQDLNADYSNFSPWYKPNFSSTRGTSFPSGHVQSACCLFTFILIWNTNKRWISFKKVIVSILFTVFIILMMFSRIILSKHYFTDTLMSIFLASIYFLFINPAIFLLIDKIRCKINKKNIK
ncbi:phosphatase PAP2 family protein [Spiroplasma endosymbiont of Labia minor]|uniref:phosphatase PAP2 family protein n=1 Tax=Spiroplasma endosymbiont of Labia minor TaxID=3066305 RepID=UPI0030D27506